MRSNISLLHGKYDEHESKILYNKVALMIFILIALVREFQFPNPLTLIVIIFSEKYPIETQRND